MPGDALLSMIILTLATGHKEQRRQALSWLVKERSGGRARGGLAAVVWAARGRAAHDRDRRPGCGGWGGLSRAPARLLSDVLRGNTKSAVL